MTRKSPQVLYVAPEVAPVSGDGDLAVAAHALGRALAAAHVAVTAVAPKGERDPERFGLARRLEHLPVPAPGSPADGAVPVTVYEGSLPNGGVKVFLVEPPAGFAGDPMDLTCRAALEIARHLDRWPEVVHATDRTTPVLELARAEATAGAPAPATVVTLLPRGDDELAAADIAAADLVAVPSRHHAAALGDARGRAVPHGIDEPRWDPTRDPHIPAPLVPGDREAKAACKLELQRELGLPPRAREALIAATGPYARDLVTPEAADALATSGAQLAFLVDPDRERDALTTLREVSTRYPTRVVVREVDRGAGGASSPEAITHRLVAGADFAVIPHRFVPHGHGELHVLHYGAIPIAPRSGAFADALVDFDAATATGTAFLFAPKSDRELVTAARRAIRTFQHRDSLELLRDRGMRTDLSWRTAARQYAELYREALRMRQRRAA